MYGDTVPGKLRGVGVGGGRGGGGLGEGGGSYSLQPSIFVAICECRVPYAQIVTDQLSCLSGAIQVVFMMCRLLNAWKCHCASCLQITTGQDLKDII